MQKNLFLCLFALLLSWAAIAQNEPQKVPVPRLKKYDLGDSKCQAYLPVEPQTVDVSKSEDGSTVYTVTVEHGGFTWSVICVQFAEPIGSDKESLEAMLTAYLDFLQANVFNITGATGYGKGHTLESNPKATGIIDYWEDAEEVQYTVASWIDANHLAVLLLSGKTEYPYFNAVQMFKNGFRFPE